MTDHGPRIAHAFAHFQAGRVEQARAVLQRILQQSPNHPDACTGMALILGRLGQHEQALFFAQRAAAARPGDPAALVNLGNALGILNRADEARDAFERALAIRPDLLPARLGLVNLLRNAGEFSAAAAHLEFCLSKAPNDPAFSALYAAVLTNLARARESVAFARRALAANPRDLALASMLCNAVNYDETATPEDAFAVHQDFGRRLAAAIGPSASPPFRNEPDPDRPLRVGLLSHDLRRHSVAFFLGPLLANLDRSVIALTAYHTSPREDEVSEHLRAMVPTWRNVAKLDDAALVERIRADGVDILLETSGHTQGNRLSVLARRAAPIQASLIGYPNTTGVAAIDYRFTDTFADPPGADDRHAERLIRLDPCFLCYDPPRDAPDPAHEPNGDTITFASFNAAMKINDPLIALWSRLLAEVPAARLLLKAFDFRDAALRDAIRARFAAAGADPARIEILPPIADSGGHLALYRRVDIALDTFPYHGTTTTCEALYMGVPVVTLAGRTHAARVGVSLLNAVGLPDLIANTPDDYIATARGLAADPARRASLRETLRQRVLDSPLCDGPAYAARFTDALRTIWRDWCAAAR